MVAYTFHKRHFDIIYQNYSVSSYTITIFVQIKLTHVRVIHGNIKKRENCKCKKDVLLPSKGLVSRESN